MCNITSIFRQYIAIHFFRVLEFSIGVLVSQMNLRSETDNKLILFLRKPYICILTVISLIVGISIAYHIGIPTTICYIIGSHYLVLYLC